MRTSSRIIGVAILLLVGCATDAGTPCRYDYQCFSNSCTLGTCDAFNFDRSEQLDPEPPEATPSPNNATSPSSQSACAPVCGIDCATRLEQGLGCGGWLDCFQTEACAEPCSWIDSCTLESVER